MASVSMREIVRVAHDPEEDGAGTHAGWETLCDVAKWPGRVGRRGMTQNRRHQ